MGDFLPEGLPALMAELLTFQKLGLIVLGVAVGLIGGALPGISASVAIALVLPLTFTLDPTSALILLGAIYMAAEYGGSISAILINTPGTPAAICTALDGHPMAVEGRAREALYVAVIASSIGGFFGVAILLLFTPPLAAFSLVFGAPEMFWLAVAGLAIVCSLAADNFLKGVIAAGIGLWIATIGQDPATGFYRYTFGSYYLEGGVELVPALLGFFAVAQMLTILGTREGTIAKLVSQAGALHKAVALPFKQPILVLRSSLIGVIVGILPGAGASIASFVSYGEAKRFSRNSEKFGKGAAEGIFASECANNAMVGGSLVPLLALGIPGSASAAILFGALTMNGLVPGPQLFAERGDIVYSFILSFIPIVLVMLLLGLFSSRIYAAVLRVKVDMIVPAVLVLAIIGSYAVRNSLFDVWVTGICGLGGFFLLRFGFSLPPLILGMVLGPLLEDNFRRALVLSSVRDSTLEYFVTRPISLVLMVVTLLMIVSAFWQEIRRRRRLRGDAETMERPNG